MKTFPDDPVRVAVGIVVGLTYTFILAVGGTEWMGGAMLALTPLSMTMASWGIVGGWSVDKTLGDRAVELSGEQVSS